MYKLKIKPVEEMTIEELIGQVVMIGLPSTTIDQRYIDFIKDKKFGNYILFARNYNDTVQMKSMMKELYDFTEEVTGSFPLVSIDQEGGMVVRLFKDVTFPASPLTTAATDVENAPYKTGYIIGKDMLKIGINLNLAPCLEINNKLLNPLSNVRIYGQTKEAVLKHARGFIDGLHAGGVLSCIKHFPGAGSSEKDSHLELPIIDDPQEDLLNFNMYPFRHLLESDALMTSHCLYQSFDVLPSTLSPVLLTQVLRNEFGFKGLIISDGMEMKAISDHYGVGEGCVLALIAGCDLLLLCHEYDDQLNAYNAIYEAVKNGRISKKLLQEKVRRINLAKENVKAGLEKNFSEEPYEVIQEEHDLMQEIVDKSYTLIKGDAPKLEKNSLVITCNAKVASIVEDEFDQRDLTQVLKRSFPNYHIEKFNHEQSFVDEVLKNRNNYDNIIVYSYDAYKDELQKELVNKLLEQNENIYIVSLKGIADSKYFVNLKNYSCLYEYTPNSLRTIVNQLKGDIQLIGHLPE